MVEGSTWKKYARAAFFSPQQHWTSLCKSASDSCSRSDCTSSRTIYQDREKIHLWIKREVADISSALSSSAIPFILHSTFFNDGALSPLKTNIMNHVCFSFPYTYTYTHIHTYTHNKHNFPLKAYLPSFFHLFSHLPFIKYFSESSIHPSIHPLWRSSINSVRLLVRSVSFIPTRIISYPILSFPILYHTIPYYPILSYPILSYPILSYHTPCCDSLFPIPIPILFHTRERQRERGRTERDISSLPSD